jgi:hypothetical protein
VILFYCDQFTLSGKSDAEIGKLPSSRSTGFRRIQSGHRRRIEQFSKGQLVKTGLW